MPQCKSRLVNCEYCEHWTARKKMRKKRAAQGTNCYGGSEDRLTGFRRKTSGTFLQPAPKNSTRLLGAIGANRLERPAQLARNGFVQSLGATDTDRTERQVSTARSGFAQFPCHSFRRRRNRDKGAGGGVIAPDRGIWYNARWRIAPPKECRNSARGKVQ